MNRNLASRAHRIDAHRKMMLIGCILLTGAALAQNDPAAPSARIAPQASASVSALLVSDIHFEPFWDPARAPQLATAPASEWKAILAAAPSPGREQRFSALQQNCSTRGADTSPALFDSSLKAMRAHADGAIFVTVSGDLISHAFPCKFDALFPHSTPQAYSAFVEKTLDYVIGEIDRAFPNVPVYIALGNNDSDCGDYRLDSNSDFLRISGKDVIKSIPASDRDVALLSFSSGGYYSASLPAPMQNARLLVLNDIFMSSHYTTCSGKSDPTASDTQLAWLRQLLTEARAGKQKIWIMGHIPPGIDLYATATKFIDVCGGQTPVMYLSSDVVELAIFAHTHMDEMRLLKNDGQTTQSVAVKMISSISPIDGNNPSFTVAQIDTASAALKNYQVFAASNQTGVDARWREEYDFARSFHEADFSASSLSGLLSSFAADPAAKNPASQNYIQDYSVGYLSPVLQAFWPQYLCTLSNHTQQSFKACACSTAR
jgi:sphingomyelin phosphodiesterase acid-like 3